MNKLLTVSNAINPTQYRDGSFIDPRLQRKDDFKAFAVLLAVLSAFIMVLMAMIGKV